MTKTYIPGKSIVTAIILFIFSFFTISAGETNSDDIIGVWFIEEGGIQTEKKI